MNFQVFKDVKLVSGLVSSIILSIIGLLLATYNISYWAFFVMVSMIVLFLSIYRVDKLMKNS